MDRKHWKIYLYLAVILAALPFLIVNQSAYASENPYDCEGILTGAAIKAGIEGEFSSDSGIFGAAKPTRCCRISYRLKKDPALPDGSYDSSITPSLTQTYLQLCEYSLANDAFRSGPPFPTLPDGYRAIKFHEYDAKIYSSRKENSIDWWMKRGDTGYMLRVETHYWWNTAADNGSAPDPLPIAEALLLTANDLLPVSTQTQKPNILPSPTSVIVETDLDVQSSSEADKAAGLPPAEQDSPAASDAPIDSEDNYLFGIPAPIFWGSLVTPFIGALAGSLLAAVISVFTSIGENAATVFGSLPDLGLSKLNSDLEKINQGLVNDNYYVINPYQGDPTLIIDGLVKLGNGIWDYTAGRKTGSKGITCDEYVDLTFIKVKEAVQNHFGPGAKVQSILFEELSTNAQKSNLPILDLVNEFDKMNDDNHNLIKLTLADGSEWAIDFHQHNIDSRNPILRPWHEVRKIWQDYMGSEFSERIVH